MRYSTWLDLVHNHCTRPALLSGDGNLLYEALSNRRYNYAPSKDINSLRLLFLNPVLDEKRNRTLVRQGRFIWCKNLQYEGLSSSDLRQVSFTIDRGKKRFTVTENNLLCLPAKIFVNNSRYLREKHRLFHGFSSVFNYENSIQMMLRGPSRATYDYEDLVNIITSDNPYRPGTLVAPREGYFYPSPSSLSSSLEEAFRRFISEVPLTPDEHRRCRDTIFSNRQPHRPAEWSAFERFVEWSHADAPSQHPCGIILGPSFENNKNTGREFYRVRFGETTYEKVHPVEMEII